MAKLVIVARNVCGQPAPFQLYGFNKEDVPDVSSLQLNAPVLDMQDAVARIETDAGQSVWPGEDFVKEAEVSHDLRKLIWRVPFKNRQRFVLRVFRWGDHNLVPGLPSLM